MKKNKPSKLRMNLSGARIRAARLGHNPPLTQVILVRRLNARGLTIDQAKLSRIESHERGVTDLDLKAFASCLKTTIAWLCGERGAKRFRMIAFAFPSSLAAPVASLLLC